MHPFLSSECPKNANSRNTYNCWGFKSKFFGPKNVEIIRSKVHYNLLSDTYINYCKLNMRGLFTMNCYEVPGKKIALQILTDQFEDATKL